MNNLLAISNDFTLDTLIALISCIVAIIALFVGGNAYHECHKHSNKFENKKIIQDNGTDNSQQAETIINYNGADSATTTALMDFTKFTFKDCMDKMYERFAQREDDNLKRIIDQTNQIIRDNKLKLGAYTKLDWINVYFESAKHSSDEFMQNIWAKVLAKEVSCPNSFSYKTLDILKNMSSEDFTLFQKLCSLQLDGYILQDAETMNNYLSWIDMLKLRDFSLLNLEPSTKTYNYKQKTEVICVYQNQYALVIYKDSEDESSLYLPIYTLSSFAHELIKIANITTEQDYIIAVARYMKKQTTSYETLKLHRIDHIEGPNLTVDTEDIISE